MPITSNSDIGVLSKVADTLVDKSANVKVHLLYPSWWQKLLQKTGKFKLYREFVVKPASAAKFLRISQLFLEVDVSWFDSNKRLESIHKLATTHSRKLVEAVAIVLYYGKEPPKRLIDFLSNNLDQYDLAILSEMVFEFSDCQSFITSIAFMTGIDLLKVNPRDQESQKIASGKQLAA